MTREACNNAGRDYARGVLFPRKRVAIAYAIDHTPRSIAEWQARFSLVPALTWREPDRSSNGTLQDIPSNAAPRRAAPHLYLDAEIKPRNPPCNYVLNLHRRIDTYLMPASTFTGRIRPQEMHARTLAAYLEGRCAKK